MSHSLNLVNPKAEIAGGGQALALNINAGKGLQNVLKSNLGPRGTMKMYKNFSLPYLANLQIGWCLGVVILK